MRRGILGVGIVLLGVFGVLSVFALINYQAANFCFYSGLCSLTRQELDNARLLLQAFAGLVLLGFILTVAGALMRDST